MKLTVKLGMMVEEGCEVQMTNNAGAGNIVEDEVLPKGAPFQMWQEGVGRVVSCEPVEDEGCFRAVLEVPDEWAPLFQNAPLPVSVGVKDDGVE